VSSPTPRDLTPPTAGAELGGPDLGAADDHVVGRRAALHRGGAVLGVAAATALIAPSAAGAVPAPSAVRPRTPECLADLQEG